MTPEEIRARLQARQASNQEALAERGRLATARDQAQEAWATSANPEDTSSAEFVAAREATAAVEAADEQVRAGETAERDILRMLAQRDPSAFEQTQREAEQPVQRGPFDMAAHVRTAILAPHANLLEGLARGGAVARTELGSIPRDVTATLLTTAGLNGAVPADRRGIMQPEYNDRLVLQQLGTGTTDSNLIEYWQVSYTRAATGIAEGALKPEAAMSLVKADAPVRTIPVWIPVTRQSLSDLAGLQSMIEGLLENDVNLEVEEEALAGDGTGDDLLGILNISNIGHVNLPVGGDLLAGIRKAMTRVRQGKGRANFVAINPEDWEEIVLTREDQTGSTPKGGYILGGPGAASEADTVWRVPVIESDSIPRHNPLVGDGRGASLLVREDTTIALSEHDDVNFRKNLVTIRAEARVALPVWRPGYFCEVTRATS